MKPILMITLILWTSWLPTLIQAAETTQPTTLRTERIHPQTISTPIPDSGMTTEENLSLIQQLLLRGDRILDPGVEIPGYILGTLNGHQSISQRDLVLIHYPDPLPVESSLDILRPGPELFDPKTEEPLGRLFFRLGSVHTQYNTPQGLVAKVTSFVSTIQPGDRLARPHPINTDFILHTQTRHALSGPIIYIQDNLEEAASHMIVIVALGRQDQAVQGLTLPIYRSGALLTDPVTRQSANKPDQLIGYAILLQIGNKASLAMLDKTRKPVHLGDVIRSPDHGP